MPSRHRLRYAATGLALVAAVTACGPDQQTAAPGPRSQPSATSTPEPTTTPDSPPPPSATPTRARPGRGVDVSHHQGAIDWRRVSRDRIDFAYLKATEGSSFTDPQFASHAREARRAGLRVGGYHYFTLCSPGAPQADHFASVLASAPARTMPPAIDLELLGNCADPPPRQDLLREVRTFIETVEERTRQRVVVYAYPDLEERYRISTALDRRLWVRRIGDSPPAGDWWMWQRDDRARVDGIGVPVDLNQLAD